MREEKRERVENVGEVGGYKKGTGEENEYENEKVKGGGRGVFTEKGIARARVCRSLGFGNRGG